VVVTAFGAVVDPTIGIVVVTTFGAVVDPTIGIVVVTTFDAVVTLGGARLFLPMPALDDELQF